MRWPWNLSLITLTCFAQKRASNPGNMFMIVLLLPGLCCLMPVRSRFVKRGDRGWVLAVAAAAGCQDEGKKHAMRGAEGLSSVQKSLEDCGNDGLLFWVHLEECTCALMRSVSHITVLHHGREDVACKSVHL